MPLPYPATDTAGAFPGPDRLLFLADDLSGVAAPPLRLPPATSATLLDAVPAAAAGAVPRLSSGPDGSINDWGGSSGNGPASPNLLFPRTNFVGVATSFSMLSGSWLLTGPAASPAAAAAAAVMAAEEEEPGGADTENGDTPAPERGDDVTEPIPTMPELVRRRDAPSVTGPFARMEPCSSPADPARLRGSPGCEPEPMLFRDPGAPLVPPKDDPEPFMHMPL